MKSAHCDGTETKTKNQMLVKIERENAEFMIEKQEPNKS